MVLLVQFQRQRLRQRRQPRDLATRAFRGYPVQDLFHRHRRRIEVIRVGQPPQPGWNTPPAQLEKGSTVTGAPPAAQACELRGTERAEDTDQDG